MANGGSKNKPNLPKYRKEKGTSYNFKKDLETSTGSSDQPYIVYDMQFKTKPSKKHLDKVKANTPMRNGAIDKLIYRYEP
jgi:hypothetical protein|tara:strand:+ start:402 stop:641 length:240 start_codon:yes stop_codon:yes gene_type:complete